MAKFLISFALLIMVMDARAQTPSFYNSMTSTDSSAAPSSAPPVSATSPEQFKSEVQAQHQKTMDNINQQLTEQHQAQKYPIASPGKAGTTTSTQQTITTVRPEDTNTSASSTAPTTHTTESTSSTTVTPPLPPAAPLPTAVAPSPVPQQQAPAQTQATSPPPVTQSNPPTTHYSTQPPAAAQDAQAPPQTYTGFGGEAKTNTQTPSTNQESDESPPWNIKY